MGDCARIVFHCPSESLVSPIVYLHSLGGLVLYILEESLPRLRTGDVSYSCARFIGECHVGMSGNTGLGIFNLEEPAAEKGESKEAGYHRRLKSIESFPWEERGLFLVNVDNWQVTHAGSCTNSYGDAGDGFGMQEQTELESVNGVVQLPRERAGRRNQVLE